VALAASAVFRQGQPEAIAGVLEGYRSSKAPQGAPERDAPDLSAAGLDLDAEGITPLGSGLDAVDTFTYVTTDGARVVLYVSAVAFPRPRGVPEGGPPDRWSIEVDGVFMASVEEPNAFLLAGSDRDLVEHAAELVEDQIEPSRFQGHRPGGGIPAPPPTASPTPTG